ncbi:MAG: caspase family protein [Geminicoccaceae bacterium]
MMQMFVAARSRMAGVFIIACLTMSMTTSAVLSATDGRRVALVIGNGAYTKIPILGNPTRDAQLIATKLRSVGFEVEMAIDGNRQKLEQSVRSFGRRARGADAALFYYAGHGVQSKGQNYLLPVDANVSEVADLHYESLPLSLVTDELEYSGAKISLLVLDACRDNPLTRSLRGRAGTRSADVSKGLASVQRASGMLIAYATAPGDVAYDGENSDNSPFTSAFANWIEEPGLEVALMFRRVREQVVNSTDGKQVPWVEEAILGDFYFKPEAPEPTPAAVVPVAIPRDQELEKPTQTKRPDSGGDVVVAAWSRARSENTRHAYEWFITLYPDSPFTHQANDLLSQLSPSGSPGEADPSAARPDTSATDDKASAEAGESRGDLSTTIRIIENNDDIPGLY